MTDYQQTHWDIADVGAVCHDECAVAQIKAAALAMRERCAQVCESFVAAEYRTGKVDHNEQGWTQKCAAAIRALET